MIVLFKIPVVCRVELYSLIVIIVSEVYHASIFRETLRNICNYLQSYKAPHLRLHDIIVSPEIYLILTVLIAYVSVPITRVS